MQLPTTTTTTIHPRIDTLGPPQATFHDTDTSGWMALNFGSISVNVFVDSLTTGQAVALHEQMVNMVDKFEEWNDTRVDALVDEVTR